MGRLLEKELRELGLEDVELDGRCYVYGYLNRANREKRVVLLAHMDVSPAAPSEDVRPVVRTFENAPIELESGQKIELSDLQNIAPGEKLVTSDGRTLLGGDDKAGVAAITTLLSALKKL